MAYLAQATYRMPAPVPACQGTGLSGICVLPSGGRRDASHALPLPAVGMNSTHQSEKENKSYNGKSLYRVREESCQTLLCYGKDKEYFPNLFIVPSPRKR